MSKYVRMEKKKILFISQEITPYVTENEQSYVGRYLPQGIQEAGKEVRVFMPRFGSINERRNQLHEVIRLSGINVIIDDNDHSLIIKVASIQQARMQVYFIDNEDFFKRKGHIADEKGQMYPDNDERIIFFARGVLETVKKLRWIPDLVHCHGWMTALVPFFLKNNYKNDPVFSNTKVVYTAYNDFFEQKFNPKFPQKLKTEGITDAEITQLETNDYEGLMKFAFAYSDAYGCGHTELHKSVSDLISNATKPVLQYHGIETYIEAHSEFYDKILSDK